MLTIKQHLESLPQPYRDEALNGSYPSRLNDKRRNLYLAIEWGVGDVTVKNILLAKCDAGEFDFNPEPRPEMAMPIIHGDPSLLVDEKDDTLTDYTYTDSDKFTEQFQPLGTHINHNEYLN